MDFIQVETVDNTSVKVPVTDSLIVSILPYIRTKGLANKKFDINLREGKVVENSVASLLRNPKVEVKSDHRVGETGNLAIEFMCRNQPSGISTSTAEWWAIVPKGEKYNDELVILLKRDRLLRMIQGCRTVKGGDTDGGKRGVAEMFLLPVHRIVQPLDGKSS